MRLLICLLLFLMGAAPAHAQARRVALVIGESSYRTVSPLANPGADANLVASAFARAGFDVRLGLDLDKAGMESALDDFARDAQQADVAAIYYAGHGFEADGRNWLVPIDASINGAQDLSRAAVPFEAAARALIGARVKVVALDACRDNPFAARAAQGGGAINRGLAEVELDGFVIVYAAAVGAVAQDGDVNSPFATSFARWVSEPNVDLRLLAGRIRDDVMATTNGQQRPFVSASLSGEATALSPMPAGRVRGAASVRERPSTVFDFVRRVRDENCFETRTVRCRTTTFAIAGNRLTTIEDDGKVRVWDASGATLQRALTPPAHAAKEYATRGPAWIFAGEVEDRIGVHTPLTSIGLDGRQGTGSVEHGWNSPSLLAAAGAPPIAVFGYANECRLGFFDARTFADLGMAVWAPPLQCGMAEVKWIFGDENSDRVIAGVINPIGDEQQPEVLLMSARNASFVCRIPGASPDAAFNEIGGIHVATDAGTIVAYDGRCRALRTDRLHRAEVTGVYPFDRTRMMSRSIDGVVKVWGAANGRVERELTGLPRRANIAHISDGGGGSVLIINEDRRLYVWTGEPRLGAYVGPSSPVCRGVLSPDANMLYALTCDGALEVWRRRS